MGGAAVSVTAAAVEGRRVLGERNTIRRRKESKTERAEEEEEKQTEHKRNKQEDEASVRVLTTPFLVGEGAVRFLRASGDRTGRGDV